jgi:dethiobiotin synthetase
VTQAKDADAGFDLDQSPFGGWQMNSPLQKKASQGLYMAAPQPSPRFKARAGRPHLPLIRKGLLRLGYLPCRLRSLQSSHRLILIEAAGGLVIKRKTP